jgi:hypothetical protein
MSRERRDWKRHGAKCEYRNCRDSWCLGLGLYPKLLSVAAQIRASRKAGACHPCTCRKAA